MSEYKITVQSSRHQYWLGKSFLLLCGLSIWLWPSMVSWQWVVQLLLSAGCVWLVVSGKFIDEPEKAEQQLVLSDTGEVQLLVDGELTPFKLSPVSVTSDWFCYLVLVPHGLFGAGQNKRRFWVFRDGVDEVSFRRLCRVIHRLRRG
ncbi:MAG: hypothetical protein HRT35_18610 [Algicola sp.]|nr:hypothetical protein [Algicola sp.]